MKPSTINVPVSVIGLEQLGILGEIVAERRRQDEKFGDQSWRPDTSKWYGGIPPVDPHMSSANSVKELVDFLGKQELIDSEVSLGYDVILLEEVYEAIEESQGGDRERLRAELVQVAAVAVAWIESIDKRTKGTS